jgi:hypothetical protein
MVPSRCEGKTDLPFRYSVEEVRLGGDIGNCRHTGKENGRPDALEFFHKTPRRGAAIA